MPFTMPDSYNKMKANGEPKSTNTIAMYKTHLNKIANATGYTTVEEFIEHITVIVKTIDKICVQKDDEADATFRSRKRVFYSAIFMILPPEMSSQPNDFYLANRKLQDGNPADFKI